MNISEDKNNDNYVLSSGSSNNKDNLNYNYADINNYQSWSNVGSGHIHISAIDENNNVIKSSFHHNRLQGLKTPHMSFANTKLVWAQSNEHAKPINKVLHEKQN